MSAFTDPTQRALRSDLYRAMVQRGWAWQTPYEFANFLCAVWGIGVHDLGLSWEVTPGTATKVRDMEATVPTIDLLLALGYGTRRMALAERWVRHARP